MVTVPGVPKCVSRMDSSSDTLDDVAELGLLTMELEDETQQTPLDVGTGRDETKVKVKVLLFARAREIVGESELDLAVTDGATTADCVAELTTRFAGLEVMRDNILVALNLNYVADPVKVKDGDELAIIPPISGG